MRVNWAVCTLASILILGTLGLFQESFAEDNNIENIEEFVMKTIDGKLVVEKIPITVTYEPLAEIPSKKQKTDFKFDFPFITPLLQHEIDSGNDPLDIVIGLKPVHLFNFETSNPTKEQLSDLSQIKKDEIYILQKPMIEFLEKNNAIILYRYESVNGISAQVPSSLIDELLVMDNVYTLDSNNVVLSASGEPSPPDFEEINPEIFIIKITDDDTTLEFIPTYDERLNSITLEIPANIFTKNSLNVSIDDSEIPYEISATEKSTIIKLFLIDSNESENLPISYPPPKQQLKSIDISEIKCNANLILIFKLTDDSPACVKTETAEKLILRGWGSY